ncbi:MAG: phenylacetate--CoA ligase family protein [Thermoplasmata archaeon]|nr:MAG: phenylacetate--CoA ligase family protein [Thermoplasmata archaeon]
MSSFQLFRAAWTYLREKNRIYRMDHEGLLKLAGERLRKQVKRAYHDVPFYRDIYRGIEIDKVRSIEDIKKLPVVTKSQLRDADLGEIMPSNPENLIPVSTSGTTGKPLTVYVSPLEMVHGLIGYIRALDRHGIDWRKSKMAIIMDLREDSAETGYMKKFISERFPSMLRNVLMLNTNDKPRKVMKELESFQPDFVGGYAGMLAHLALLQQKGYGEIYPSKVASTGSCMSGKLKKFIEKTFDAKLFEVYGATETGPISFECEHGKMHVNEDLVIMEVLGKRIGKAAVTKLYGEGTPIIRYNGISDIVEIGRTNCKCGLDGMIIKKIYGRDNLAIYRKDGAILTPSVFAEIFSPLIYRLKTNRVKATKVIQHSLDRLEIRVVLDEKNVDVGDDEIMAEIERNFRKYMGDIEITIKKVKRISRKTPTVLTKVNPEKLPKLKYL